VVGILYGFGGGTVVAVATPCLDRCLPFTARFGHWPFFAIMLTAAACYFLLSTFCIPETKGKPLEENEGYFK